jgi:hypothetical protein
VRVRYAGERPLLVFYRDAATGEPRGVDATPGTVVDMEIPAGAPLPEGWTACEEERPKARRAVPTEEPPQGGDAT